MEFSHSDYAIQVRPSTLQNVLAGLRKIFTTDPGLSLQLFLTLPIIAGGIVLHLNAIQWVLILVVTAIFLVAGIFRRAALLQVNKNNTLSEFHVSRIKCMGNAIVMLTAGISVLTYMLVFVPIITQLL